MSLKRISILSVVLFVVALAFATTCHAADPPTPTLVPQNNYQAYAYSVGAAHQAKSDQCESKTGALKVMAAKCASDICLALFADKVERACDGAGGGQALTAQAPAEERSTVEKVGSFLLDTARVALPFVDRFMASKERRDSLQSAERQNVALYGTFSTINGQTAALGTAGFGSLERLGTAGFGSLERGMTAAFTAPRDPTYQVTVNGDDNALFGSTSNRSYTNNCTSGNAAAGGNAGSGGQGGQNGAGGNSQGGNGAPSGSVPCSIQK